MAGKNPTFSPAELLWYRETPGFDRRIWWKGEEESLLEGDYQDRRRKKRSLNVAPVAWELLRRHPDWRCFFEKHPLGAFPKEGREWEAVNKMAMASRVAREETGSALPAAICMQGGKTWPDLHPGLRRFFNCALPSFLESELVDESFSFRLFNEPLIDLERKWHEEIDPPAGLDPWTAFATGLVKPNLAVFVNTDSIAPEEGLLSIDHIQQLREDLEAGLRRGGWRFMTVGISRDASNIEEVLTAFRKLLEESGWKPGSEPKHKTQRRKLEVIAELEASETPDDDLRKRMKELFRGVTFHPYLKACENRDCWATK